MNEIKFSGKNVIRMPDDDCNLIFEIVLTAVGILALAIVDLIKGR